MGTAITIMWALMLGSPGPGPQAAAEKEAPAVSEDDRPYRKPKPITFIRIRGDRDGNPTALQVANVRYVPMDGSTLNLTLYGAVHVGEPEYYAHLNQSFSQHDALLYELANDPQVLRERTRDPMSILSMFQMDLGEMMGLTKQLDAVDYDRPNFVHADIPMSEILDHARTQGDDLLTVATQTLLDFRRMINRGEDPMSTVTGSGNGEATPPTPADPFGGMFGMSGDPRQMKLAFAKQLAVHGSGGIEGITVLNRYLIKARNRRCLKVLEQQIAQGKDDIGIFYGAGHHPDFHRRLMVDYGLKPVEVTWVDAWDLMKGDTPRQHRPRELTEEELLMELLRRLMELDSQ